jgi:hypothetical protein
VGGYFGQEGGSGFEALRADGMVGTAEAMPFKAQGLKPGCFRMPSARLKRCPVTKAIALTRDFSLPLAGLCRRLRHRVPPRRDLC